jgi:hypothetical protein
VTSHHQATSEHPPLLIILQQLKIPIGLSSRRLILTFRRRKQLPRLPPAGIDANLIISRVDENLALHVSLAAVSSVGAGSSLSAVAELCFESRDGVAVVECFVVVLIRDPGFAGSRAVVEFNAAGKRLAEEPGVLAVSEFQIKGHGLDAAVVVVRRAVEAEHGDAAVDVEWAEGRVGFVVGFFGLGVLEFLRTRVCGVVL